MLDQIDNELTHLKSLKGSEEIQKTLDVIKSELTPVWEMKSHFTNEGENGYSDRLSIIDNHAIQLQSLINNEAVDLVSNSLGRLINGIEQTLGQKVLIDLTRAECAVPEDPNNVEVKLNKAIVEKIQNQNDSLISLSEIIKTQNDNIEKINQFWTDLVKNNFDTHAPNHEKSVFGIQKQLADLGYTIQKLNQKNIELFKSISDIAQEGKIDPQAASTQSSQANDSNITLAPQSAPNQNINNSPDLTVTQAAPRPKHQYLI